jgi:hypothetical protein
MKDKTKIEKRDISKKRPWAKQHRASIKANSGPKEAAKLK